MDIQRQFLLPIELSSRLRKDADSAEIVDAIQAIWTEIDASLFPILGQSGVAALYQRSMFATFRDFPWLAGTFDGAVLIVNLSLLRATLLQQTPTNARAASCVFLQTFEALLTSLVGSSLTDRLLNSVCKNSLSGLSPRGTSL